MFFNLQIIKMDLNSKDLKNKKESDSNSICLDVRTKDEFDEGYINGATNVDFYDSANFVSHLSNIDKKKSCYVYCRSGKRSFAACEIMKDLGFKNVYNLESGYMGWVENGYETIG